jgi:hypothetical protein
MPDCPLAYAELSEIRPRECVRGGWMRGCAAIGAAILALGCTALAQDDLDAPPPDAPKKDGVQITFLPPPMEGAINLGVYDSTGKLVRTLQRDATPKNFTIGLNGLIMRWDGRNDVGEPLPPGKYAVRGWTVGDLHVDGVAFHGNEWVKDDGPHYTQMLRFQKDDRGVWQVVLSDGAGTEYAVAVGGDQAEVAPAASKVEAGVEDGKLFIRQGEARTPVMLAEGEKAVKASVGLVGNVWAIVETSAGREVRSYSPVGEFLRRLAYRMDEPPPFDLAASATADAVLLLEKKDGEQRFRILAQPESTTGGSTWKTIDQKRIVASDSFASIAAHLRRAEPPQPEATVKLLSKPNPLLQNERTEVPLQAVITPDGAALSTADGLPLTQVTETKGLKWVALVREGKALLLFQSDGAVVEEFKIGQPENLMSFDAGEYTLKK